MVEVIDEKRENYRNVEEELLELRNSRKNSTIMEELFENEEEGRRARSVGKRGKYLKERREMNRVEDILLKNGVDP